jgi:hypothetical protein
MIFSENIGLMFYEIKFEHWQRNVNEKSSLVMPSLRIQNIQMDENICNLKIMSKTFFLFLLNTFEMLYFKK